MTSVGIAKKCKSAFLFNNRRPMMPVTAVTMHLPRKRMKSPTLFMVATWSALFIIVLNAWKNNDSLIYNIKINR